MLAKTSRKLINHAERMNGPPSATSADNFTVLGEDLTWLLRSDSGRKGGAPNPGENFSWQLDLMKLAVLYK